MVVAQRPMDLAALKQRHPLADVVVAAGVQLRGRVRQGLCPFHAETAGSFTVYGDTARLHCFGCGATPRGGCTWRPAASAPRRPLAWA